MIKSKYSLASKQTCMGNQQKEPLKKLIKFESLAAELAKCEEIGEI